jgi:hypothetical protein
MLIISTLLNDDDYLYNLSRSFHEVKYLWKPHFLDLGGSNVLVTGVATWMLCYADCVMQGNLCQDNRFCQVILKYNAAV